MKAAQVVSCQRIEIVETAIPELGTVGDEGLLIKTELSALCGSDMPMFVRDRPAQDYPMQPGLTVHECIGVVTESRSQRFVPGDRVLAIPRESGGLAEYFLSHESVTVPLVDFERQECVLMAQPLGTVIWACRKLGNLLNQDAVVVGQGPMGLLITHMLSNLGARKVIGVDMLDYRLAVSREMRVTHTVNASDTDTVKAVKEITGGRMADLVVEAVGHQSETLNLCAKLARDGGTVLAFGVPSDPTYEIKFKQFFRRNLRLISSVRPDAQNDLPLAMDMIVQGRIDVLPIITHRMPFTEAHKAFEMFRDRSDGAIKIVLEYESA